VVHRGGDKPAGIYTHGDGAIGTTFPYITDGTLNYYKNGLLHREGGKPSTIQYYQGEVVSETCHINGVVSSYGDKPAIKRFDIENLPVTLWYKDGVLHRDGDKPAYIKKRRDGSLFIEKFYTNGKLNRKDHTKPSKIIYDLDGVTPIEETYKISGKWYREGDKPTMVKKVREDTLEYYYKQGQDKDILFRDNDLPTRITYYKSGNIKREEWLEGDGDPMDRNPYLINYKDSKDKQKLNELSFDFEGDVVTTLYDEEGNPMV
jgi:hypothetical protein